MSVRCIIATSGAGLGLVGGVAPAAAMPAWLAPTRVSSPSAVAALPKVAMNAAGDAAVVWQQTDGINTIIQASVRPAGGAFSPPVALSDPGQNATAPQVAMNAAGDAVAVWTRSDGAKAIVQAAVRPADGSFAAAVGISAGGQDAVAPQVAIDGSANIVATWTRSDGANTIVQAAVRPTGGAFATAFDLSAAGQDASNADVAVNAGGEAVVVWSRAARIQTAARPAGGSFASPADLTTSGVNIRPQVAIGTAGDAVVVWDRMVADGGVYVASAYRFPGAAFGAPVDLSAVGAGPGLLSVAAGGSGNAIALWEQVGASSQVSVQAAVRQSGTGFGAPTTLASSGRFPAVAMNQAGDAAVAWSAVENGAAMKKGSSRPVGGVFAAPTSIGQGEGAPDVGIDQGGDAIAVWPGAGVPSAGFDRAAPTLSSISVPTTAMAGTPVSVSAGSFDVWGPVSIRVDFGDGTSQTGGAVSHVYGAAGVYRVTVTATDAVGNQAATTRSIVITPAPGAESGADPGSSVAPSGSTRPRTPPRLRPRPTLRPSRPRGPALCAPFRAGEQCGAGGGRRTAGGAAKVSHAGWPAITGILWKVVAFGGPHQKNGGPKNDELLGHHGNEVIRGGAGNDVIWGDWDPKNNGTRQVDRLFGDAGDDWIYSSHGRNTIRGGAGKDYVWAYYGRGTIDCGPGFDTLRIRVGAPYSIRNCERIKNFCSFGSRPGNRGGCYKPGEKPGRKGRS